METTTNKNNGKGRRTQKVMVREHLKAGQTLTPIKALKLFRCFRLAAVICELRKEGLKINTEIKVKSKISPYDGLPMQVNYAIYSIPKEEEK